MTDAQLSAELKKWTGAAPALHPVGELLDRHWESAFAYARLCTADARSAGMLTTAAFTRLFGETLRQTGPTAAWRPRLLVTVRRIAAEWDGDHRQELLHPELRTGAQDAERAAARLLPPADRRLLSGAFRRLPQPARCLLWHTEVESEPPSVPGALLGLDAESARVELERAGARLREECLQVHRELAPEQECRQYLRMLDVTYRRGGVDVDPDLRGHLSRCAHCSDTARQLDFFNHGLGLALAEAVLGWGARPYLESRARRTQEPAGAGPAYASGVAGESFFTDSDPRPAAPGAERPAPEAFTAPLSSLGAVPSPPAQAPAVPPKPDEAPGPRRGRRAARRSSVTTEDRAGGRACTGRVALKAARRASRRRNLSAAVATVSALVVLPLVIWSAVGSDDGGARAADGGSTRTPGRDAGSASGNPSWAGAAEAAKGDLRGKLYNLGSGLCVGIVGGDAAKDAETELTTCSAAPDQQWAYETGGLIRSGTDPELCLDPGLGYSVRLAPCTGATGAAADSIRYDFTLKGTLVPRSDRKLALSPAATDGSGALVLKSRDDDGDAQHWVIDTSRAELQMEVVNWDAESAPAPAPVPTPARTAGPSRTAPPAPAASPSASRPAPARTGDHDGGDRWSGGWYEDGNDRTGGHGGGRH